MINKSSVNLFPVDDADQHLFLGPLTVPLQRFTFDIEIGTVAGDFEKSNEDTFTVCHAGNQLILAVFDGATSLKKIPAHDAIGMSGARFASHFLRDSFLDLPTIDRDSLRTLNQMLRARTAQFEGLNPDDVTTVPTSTATIVTIDAALDQISIQHIGDSFVMVRDRNNLTRMITPDPQLNLEEELYGEIRRLAKERGISNREARHLPVVSQQLVNHLQKIFNLSDGSGFGVVNGDPHMDQYIFRAEFPISSIQSLLVASDGLPPPQYSLSDDAHVSKFLSDIESLGLQGAIDLKKEMEDRDPDWETPRWKHSDDATGILVRIR